VGSRAGLEAVDKTEKTDRQTERRMDVWMDGHDTMGKSKEVLYNIQYRIEVETELCR
jgi:hypothetical protein